MTTSRPTPLSSGSDPGADLAARFTREAAPLFEALARRARRLTDNDADAEDLLQETLLYAYAGFRSYQEGTNVAAWLFRILHNRWVSIHRRKQRRPAEVAVDEITDYDLTRAASYTAIALQSAEAQALNNLPDSMIREALAALPEGFTTALYYAEVQGYTYAETAAIMNIPIGTVMSRVFRGRQRLRGSLASLAPGRNSHVSQRIA